jgi:hypothetical protein
MKKQTNDEEECGVFSTRLVDDNNLPSPPRYFSVKRMIEVSRKNKIRYVFLEHLRHKLDCLCWQDSRGTLISPNMVLNNMKLFQWHANKIQSVDLSFPIIISHDNQTIYDGMHRLAGAFLKKDFYIKVVILSEFQLMSCEINIVL